MKKMFWAATVYTALGLAGGLYFRELTKAHDFTEHTELAVVHTHLLTLGTLGFLLFMVLERSLTLTAQPKLFAGFFWVYNAGLVLTVALMTVIGSRTVFGLSHGPALSGIAGLGHVLLTVAFALLLITIGRRVHAAAPSNTQIKIAERGPGHSPRDQTRLTGTC